MADIHYYVSQQHGDDGNTGLSAEQAWATLTKAAQTVPTPAVGDRHIVHWGPGTYREKISFTNAGRSATENIIYAPDPEARYLTDDTPGRCRLTSCDSNELPGTGRVVDWNSKSYVQFGSADADCWVDGSSDADYVMYANNASSQICRRVHVAGVYGFRYGINYNCQFIGGGLGFSNGVNYFCRAVGGNHGFYMSTNYSCWAIGGSYGFNKGTNYGCGAAGGSNGFYATTSYNCQAVGSANGFYLGTCYNGLARACNYGFHTTAVYGCSAVWCLNPTTALTGDGTVSVAKAVLGEIGQEPWLAAGEYNAGWWIPHNVDNAATTTIVDLTSERLIGFTPTETGVSKAAAVYIDTKTASGNITVELQKNISGTWTTQKSKTLPVSALTNLKFNRFEWDSGTGDDQLTAVSGTWRFRITADSDAQATTIRTSDGTAISYQGYFWPDAMPTTDILGRPRLGGNGYPDIGPWELSDYTLDWTTYHTVAPSIKISLKGQVIYQVPAKANEAITVKWWTRHHGTTAGLEPQIILRGLGITEQTDTNVSAADTWEELSVSATPAVSGVLECVLYARDTTAGSYSLFSDPGVS